MWQAGRPAFALGSGFTTEAKARDVPSGLDGAHGGRAPASRRAGRWDRSMAAAAAAASTVAAVRQQADRRCQPYASSSSSSSPVAAPGMQKTKAVRQTASKLLSIRLAIPHPIPGGGHPTAVTVQVDPPLLSGGELGIRPLTDAPKRRCPLPTVPIPILFERRGHPCHGRLTWDMGELTPKTQTGGPCDESLSTCWHGHGTARKVQMECAAFPPRPSIPV